MRLADVNLQCAVSNLEHANIRDEEAASSGYILCPIFRGQSCILLGIHVPSAVILCSFLIICVHNQNE